MLHDFVAANREQLIRRCRAKVETQSVPPPTPTDRDDGVPIFLDHLVRARQCPIESSRDMQERAGQHGRDMQLKGFSVSQVVHDHGGACQSITPAVETGAPISVEDFRALSRCLDNAIASAVTEHVREVPHLPVEACPLGDQERYESSRA